jgi:hypothetical protein
VLEFNFASIISVRKGEDPDPEPNPDPDTGGPKTCGSCGSGSGSGFGSGSPTLLFSTFPHRYLLYTSVFNVFFGGVDLEISPVPRGCRTGIRTRDLGGDMCANHLCSFRTASFHTSSYTDYKICFSFFL